MNMKGESIDIKFKNRERSPAMLKNRVASTLKGRGSW